MPRNILFIVLNFVYQAIVAQPTYWAETVLDYSSEYFSIEFSAQQCLGEPNVLLSSDMHPSAWVSRNKGQKEFLKVAFEKPLRIRQIAIVEPYKPGTLYRVYAYDVSGKEHLLIELPEGLSNRDGGLFNIFFDQTEFLVTSLKLVFDGAKTNDRVSVDAIAISDSEKPIRFETKLKQDMRFDIVVERLSETINSSVNEVKPLLSPDGKFLFFSRQNHADNTGNESDAGDIWVSEYNEDAENWSIARNAGSTLNNDGNNFIDGLMANGEGMIAVLGNRYTKRGKQKTGVSLSLNMTGIWSEPVSMDFVNDTGFKEGFDLHLSVNRKILLIANHSLATLGNKDLYVAFLQKTGKWSDPIHLGNQINTVGEECAPYLMPDNKTLYFSSDGFAGYGKKDIYVTQRLDNTWRNWSPPENLGSTINTHNDEAYFTSPTKGEYAYLSRVDSNSNADIYRVKLPLYTTPVKKMVFKGGFYDRQTNNSIAAKIYFDKGDLKSFGQTFEFMLQPGENYEFNIEADQYENQIEIVSLSENSRQESIDRKIFLVRIVEEVLIFNQITFASNKATLNQNSFQDLDKIVAMMKERPDINLEISSHTDNIGSAENNMTLSEARARTILQYLTDSSIAVERLTIKWHGESHPIATNETEEGRKTNRRVEFRVITN